MHFRGRGGSEPVSRRANSSAHFSPGRIVLASLVIFGLAWVAWRIIADTAGSNAAATSPEIAVAWMPSESEALDELATREFKKPDGDLDAARGLAGRALRSNPLDARALSILGLIAERQGDQARADSLMRQSAGRTWRDTTTQAWLINREIQLGDFDQALSHVDALLRVNPEVMEQTFPVLAAFTIDSRTRDALARLLATAPPWRTDFLTKLSTQLSNAGQLVQLYAALGAGQHPPDANELGPYLNRLINDGRFEEAFQGWRETLSPQQRTSEAHPYNGDFVAPIDGLPFNWVFRPSLGMDIQIVPDSSNAGIRALQLQFSGTRVAPFTARQLLLLPPGEYRLTGKVRSDGLRTSRGLGWQVSCAESPPNTLAVTSLIANAAPWSDFSVDFTVPAGNCRGQWLSLEIPSRTASERQIEGQIWYESLVIESVAKRQQLRQQ